MPKPSRGLASIWPRIRHYFRVGLWKDAKGAQPRSRWSASVRGVLRLLTASTQGFLKDEGDFRAAALTYTTVLSIAPVLAIAFALAKGFGAYDALVEHTVKPLLDRTFGPATATGTAPVRSAIDSLLESVSATPVSSLGVVGFALLLYSILNLLTQVEVALNRVWGIRNARSVSRRAVDYLSMFVVTTVCLIVATAFTAAAQNAGVIAFLTHRLHLGFLVGFVMGTTPLVAMWVGCTVIYTVMPAVRANAKSALLGGIVAGSSWQLLQIAHVKFQIGVAKENPLYAGFGAFPVFLVWVYASWNIILFGAELAAAHQKTPQLRRAELKGGLDHRSRELVALSALVLIGRAYRRAEPTWSDIELARELVVGRDAVRDALSPLVRKRIVVCEGGKVGGPYVPGVDFRNVRLTDVLDALRGPAGVRSRNVPKRSDGVAELLHRLRASNAASADNVTLDEVVTQFEQQGVAEAPSDVDPGRSLRMIEQ